MCLVSSKEDGEGRNADLGGREVILVPSYRDFRWILLPYIPLNFSWLYIYWHLKINGSIRR